MAIPDGHIRIRFFSVLREVTGVGEIDVDFAHGAAVADFERHLVEEYPEIAPYSRVWRTALNQRYVEGTAEVQAGDELALITPVSGG